MLANVGGDGGKQPPTDLYNEGWMLRLCLDWFSEHRSASGTLRFDSNSDWYSEALLPSAFLPRKRGDRLAESWTHADGVIGDFEIGKESIGGLSLKPGAQQLVVTEAKMFSKLSSGVKNAGYFDQAARNVACIAEVIRKAKLAPNCMARIGFFVVAPRSRIDEGVFTDQMDVENIRSVVERRVSEYKEPIRQQWFEQHFIPVLENSVIRCVSWEELINEIRLVDPSDAEHFQAFYGRCIHFNESIGRRY